MKFVKRYLKKILGFSILLSSFTSCQKYLDLQSNAVLEVPSTLKSLQALLDESKSMNYHVPEYGEISADNYYMTDETLNRSLENDRRMYIWDRQEYYFGGGNDWGKGYTPVYTANLVLETLERIPRGEGENRAIWDNVYGSAHFFRGFQFLSLAWTFAKVYNPLTSNEDLGIVLKKTTDHSKGSKRSTVEETYNQIVFDLKEAAKFLPEYSLHPMRPSKGAAYAALARTYLSTSRYDSALLYVDKAIQLHPTIMNYNSSDDIVANLLFPFKIYNNETIFFAQLTGGTVHISHNSANIDSNLYNSYESNDLRKELYFVLNQGNSINFKGNYTGGQDRFGGITTAELYLMRAECRIRSGQDILALQDLNYLLKNRYVEGDFAELQLSGKDLLSRILLERRKELIFRGLRWMDIKRLNLENPNIFITRIVGGKIYVLEPNDRKYALPIPEDIISLTDVIQN